MTTEEKAKPVTELFDQVTKNCEQMVRSSLKLQEEASKWLTGLYNQNAAQEAQKKFKAVADEFIPQTQKQIDEGLKLAEQNSKTGIDLLKKAAAVAQATSAEDAQARALRYWEASLGAMRDMAQAVTQAQTKAFETWTELVRKTTEPAPAVAKA